MNVAVAGIGSATIRGHLPAFASLRSTHGLNVVGAADPDPRRRGVIAAASPRVPVFETAEAMLDAVDCDALVVASEPTTHADLIALGMEQNLHVICEKPVVVTPAQYALVARAHARHPHLGLIPVHEYRYSPTWGVISRCARIAARWGIPFSIRVTVQRVSTDALAVSPWRSDLERHGGILADHGVHFLALGWTVTEHLDVLAGERRASGSGESAGASIRLGPGVLTIQAETGAASRRTRVELDVRGVAMRWQGHTYSVAVGGRTIIRRAVDGLADRRHVDALYRDLYADIATNLHRPAWRAHRSAEALTVARALVTLLGAVEESAEAA